jgi:acyl transferase domain-containing protein/acyl carrier protein
MSPYEKAPYENAPYENAPYENTLHKNTHQAQAEPSPSWQLLLLSAKSEQALEAGTAALVRFLRASGAKQPGLKTGRSGVLADTSFTLLAGRELFDLRKALVCADIDHAIGLLAGQAAGGQRGGLLGMANTAKNRPIVFLFAEPDMNDLHMAASLFSSQPVFRAAVERCLGALNGPGEQVLRAWLLARFGAADNGADGLHAPYQTAFAPVACFVFGYALARLWQSFGLHADAVSGDAAGECVAAHLAGYLSLADALYLVAARGRALAYGVAQSLERIAPPPESESARIEWLSAAGKPIRGDELAGPGYWLELVHAPPGAGQAASALAHTANRVVLDMVSGNIYDPTHTPDSTAQSFGGTRHADGLLWLLTTLGTLAVAGVKIDWKTYFADKAVRRIPLPTYCFDAARHWFATPEQAQVGEPERQQRQESERQQRQEPEREQRQEPEPEQRHEPERGQRQALPPADIVVPAGTAPGRNGQVEKFLLETCQQLLGIDSIGLHDNVMRLGMDSFNVMQLSQRVEQAFKLRIAPHHLFSRPDIASVAEKILALRPELGSGSAPTPAPPAKPTVPPAHHSGETHADLAEMVRFVDNLSDQEVNRLLQEMGALQGNEA